MRFAILVTNNDATEFSQMWPDDAVRFSTLVADLRPDWVFDPYYVWKGNFPDTLAHYDGVLVGGSPASANDPDAWVARLLEEIRAAYAQRIPMFGACFGHQAIAKALGGEVAANPDGWSYGCIETQLGQRPDWMAGGADVLLQYAAHKEQVIRVPEGALIISQTPGCPVGAMVMGEQVYTTQYHPEMAPDFMASLVDFYAASIGQEISEAARRTLVRVAENERVAGWIVAFFERAKNNGR